MSTDRSEFFRPATARTCASSRHAEVQLRSDQIGAAVRHWFHQLRRLQSYVHAAKNDRQDPAALTSRLELWMAIRKARGFRRGFSRWWETYHLQHPCEAPYYLPLGPPAFLIADQIYHSFLAAFRSFEQWHLLQKRKLFDMRYDRTLQALHKDLKAAPPERIALFWQDVEYEIMDIDPISPQIMLDRPVVKGTSTWSIDGVGVQISQVDDNVCELAPDSFRLPGTILTQRLFLHTAEEIHDSLLSCWHQRWNAFAEIPNECWSRVTSFIAAFVPRLQMSLPPITVGQWKAALRRYKATAARGVDGVGHQDLLHLPDHWHEAIVHWLNRIEEQQLGGRSK